MPSSSTMSRSMRQRLPLYHSLPRPASHPLSTLAVSPPSTSRPVLSSPPRLPSEAPKQSPHSQLALTQPSPGLQQAPLFPYTPPILAPALAPAAGPSSAAVPHPAPEVPRAHKRARLQYQLDVGAYGIPKSRPSPSNAHHHHHRSFHSRPVPPIPHTHRSVQVGEDAYFVTHNAMGIADGVGGWARVAPHASQHQQHPTPSALFSRRLMHFCAAELEILDAAPSATSSTAVSAGAGVRPPTTTRFSFEHHLKPRPAPPPPIRPESYPYAFAELEESLDELADGIDVLQILERAYDSTVRTHIAPSTSTSTSAPTPLTTGSSTALLAVLDHPPSGPLKQSPEAPQRNYAAGSLPLPATASQSAVTAVETTLPTDQAHMEAHATELQGSAYDAVVHIAHLGDCMGMLVRGDEIVWRSDEMWWGYNHPLQLGPPPSGTSVHITPPPPTTKTTTATAAAGTLASSVLPTSQTPTAAATISNTTTAPTSSAALIPLPVQPHTFTLPVRADDILILASDGLGDNLWDEDVLDEVLRVRDAAGLAAVTGATTPVRAPGAVSGAASTAGMVEGLRRAFVGLEVGEGVSAAAASAGAPDGTAAAYPSPPVSTSPSPPPELADASSSSSSPSPSAGAGAAHRKAFAGTLAEALCSRAKCVSERRGGCVAAPASSSSSGAKVHRTPGAAEEEEGGEAPVAPGEVPFGRRAALAGRVFRGGKCDDISVIVAVISPSPLPEPSSDVEQVSGSDGVQGVDGASTSASTPFTHTAGCAEIVS